MSPFLYILTQIILITTNRILLDRVLANLIGNAYKHHDRLDGKIRVTVEPQAQMWEITVSDDGIGIAPKDRERVFGIFQTIGNPTQQSTGIGLAIVEKIVKSQGGTISIGDSIDRGTTFRFTWSVATVLTWILVKLAPILRRALLGKAEGLARQDKWWD